MRPRPLEFFGPEDWTGGKVADDKACIAQERAEWDCEYDALPWWVKFFWWIFRA